MAQAKVTIVTSKGERTVQVRVGLGFQALAGQHETALEFDCREADCGICMIKVLEGGENLSPAVGNEAECLRAMHADPDERLACQTRILGDCKVFIDDP